MKVVSHSVMSPRLNHLIEQVGAALTEVYPDFEAWLNTTFIPELVLGLRDIATVECDGLLVGLVLLKLNRTDPKICTLYVLPNYRRIGVGRLLLTYSFTKLKDFSPTCFLTCRAQHVGLFKQVFKYKRYNIDILKNQEYIFKLSL